MEIVEEKIYIIDSVNGKIFEIISEIPVSVALSHTKHDHAQNRGHDRIGHCHAHNAHDLFDFFTLRVTLGYHVPSGYVCHVIHTQTYNTQKYN